MILRLDMNSLDALRLWRMLYHLRVIKMNGAGAIRIYNETSVLKTEAAMLGN